MRVARVSTETRLKELRAEWNALGDGIPFRSWQWLHTWWHHYRADRELYVLEVRTGDGCLVGIAPWFLENQKYLGRTLQFLGAGEVCSDHLGLLINRREQNQVVRAVAAWLAGQARRGDTSRWDFLQMEGVTDRDGSIHKLAACLRKAGCAVHCRTLMNGWRLSLPDAWQDLTKRLGKSTRRNAKQNAKRLDNDPRVTIERAADIEQFSEAVGVLVELHQRRRNSLGQSGCFRSPAFTSFIVEVARLMLGSGELELPILRIDGEPAACQLNLVRPLSTYHYQSGINPDLLKESPGSLLMTAQLQAAIGKGQREYDFLRGDESYKANWRGQPYPVLQFRIAANRLRPQMVQRAWQSVTATKKWFKRGNVTESHHPTSA
jgi:CelD/BcsL family acetyltransferase involved in cellulose biosynthesis